VKRTEENMLNVEIPGWGDMDIGQIILDLNGTLATDGKIVSDIKEKTKLLAQNVKVYILSADTQGTAAEVCQDLGAELVKVSPEESGEGKLAFLEKIGPEGTVVIGNGDNDHAILKEAALGIAVLGDEGLSISALMNADVLVKKVSDALDLFLKPRRLIATLRR
jgi:P-type E1-E2 ATPase